eukprot:jgi/Mesvir1/19957/Mv13216-RA.1
MTKSIDQAKTERLEILPYNVIYKQTLAHLKDTEGLNYAVDKLDRTTKSIEEGSEYTDIFLTPESMLGIASALKDVFKDKNSREKPSNLINQDNSKNLELALTGIRNEQVKRPEMRTTMWTKMPPPKLSKDEYEKIKQNVEKEITIAAIRKQALENDGIVKIEGEDVKVFQDPLILQRATELFKQTPAAPQPTESSGGNGPPRVPPPPPPAKKPVPPPLPRSTPLPTSTDKPASSPAKSASEIPVAPPPPDTVSPSPSLGEGGSATEPAAKPSEKEASTARRKPKTEAEWEETKKKQDKRAIENMLNSARQALVEQEVKAQVAKLIKERGGDASDVPEVYKNIEVPTTRADVKDDIRKQTEAYQKRKAEEDEKIRKEAELVRKEQEKANVAEKDEKTATGFQKISLQPRQSFEVGEEVVSLTRQPEK